VAAVEVVAATLIYKLIVPLCQWCKLSQVFLMYQIQIHALLLFWSLKHNTLFFLLKKS
jgi:hypothetical protein